jgi:hypothetical protein
MDRSDRKKPNTASEREVEQLALFYVDPRTLAKVLRGEPRVSPRSRERVRRELLARGMKLPRALRR